MLKKFKENIWAYGAMGGIILSLLSLLLPVLRYTTGAGWTYRYSLPAMLRDMNAFLDRVFGKGEYVGSFLRYTPFSVMGVFLVVLSVFAVGAIVLSFVGLITLSVQYSNRRSYVLSICGLVGTAIPAVVLLVLVLISGSSFTGTIRCGLYAYITPLAMLLSCRAVTYKHRLSLAQLEAEKKAEDIVYRPESF